MYLVAPCVTYIVLSDIVADILQYCYDAHILVEFMDMLHIVAGCSELNGTIGAWVILFSVRYAGQPATAMSIYCEFMKRCFDGRSFNNEMGPLMVALRRDYKGTPRAACHRRINIGRMALMSLLGGSTCVAARCLHSYNSDGLAIQMLDGLIIDTNWYVQCVCITCSCHQAFVMTIKITITLQASCMSIPLMEDVLCVAAMGEKFLSVVRSGKNRNTWYGGMPTWTGGPGSISRLYL